MTIPAEQLQSPKHPAGAVPAAGSSRRRGLIAALRRVRRWLLRTMSAIGGWLDRHIRRVCARSGLMASVYYCIVSAAFRREQAAVLAGWKIYSEKVADPSLTSPLLRRNVHRLEKGMLMRPRRRVFATGYIEATVDCYVTMSAAASAEDDNAELRWASHVLARYFEITEAHPATQRARKKFASLDRRTEAQGTEVLVPYRRSVGGPTPVTYQSLYELSRQRRSVRWFLPKPVPRCVIDNALMVSAQAPSACNRQPFVFRIFDEPEDVRQVARVPMGTVGYEHNIPAIAVVVGQLRNYPNERDRHLIYIDAGLAVMGFLYALESQGVSTCCINWPDIDEREEWMSRLLDLDPDERVVMCVAIGYPDPDGLVAYSQKKPLSQFRQYNSPAKESNN